jgi:hypothetical protein
VDWISEKRRMSDKTKETWTMQNSMNPPEWSGLNKTWPRVSDVPDSQALDRQVTERFNDKEIP